MAQSTKRHIYFGLLFLVSILGLFCGYWLVFYLFRSAADPANNPIWQPHILGWFLAFIVALALWIGDVVAFFRTYPKSSPDKSSGIIR
jgi:CDP-diglyceride synthetase